MLSLGTCECTRAYTWPRRQGLPCPLPGTPSRGHGQWLPHSLTPQTTFIKAGQPETEVRSPASRAHTARLSQTTLPGDRVAPRWHLGLQVSTTLLARTPHLAQGSQDRA